MKRKIKLHFQRFEFKYQMPAETIEGIIPELLKYMNPDPYARDLPNSSYFVGSLYYDSAGLDCYYQKLAGLRSRRKLRIRFYEADLLDSSSVFVEIKKKYDAVVVKDRVSLSYGECKEMMLNNQLPKEQQYSDRDDDFLRDFLRMKLYNGMMPQNLVMYHRRPFISKVDPHFRVTIDHNLRTYAARWIDEHVPSTPVNPGFVILEVKFNNVLPFWFHRIIQRYNLEQRPFSKYCESLDVCKPHLLHGNIQDYFRKQMAV
jgi:hypothetical protein